MVGNIFLVVVHGLKISTLGHPGAEAIDFECLVISLLFFGAPATKEIHFNGPEIEHIEF